jgi:hypothetical protein
MPRENFRAIPNSFVSGMRLPVFPDMDIIPQIHLHPDVRIGDRREKSAVIRGKKSIFVGNTGPIT